MHYIILKNKKFLGDLEDEIANTNLDLIINYDKKFKAENRLKVIKVIKV